MSTIIYTITLQVLQLSVTCLIMFFVREHYIKVVTFILVTSACSIYGEPPIPSSYLPPKRDEQSQNKFSTFSQPSINLNTNYQPTETPVSFTTNEPLEPFFPSSSGTSKNSDNPSSGYSPSGSSGRPSNDEPSVTSYKNNGGNFNNIFSQPPRNAQQSTGGNTGYFYKQPSPTFGDSSTTLFNEVSQNQSPSAALQSTRQPGISNSYFNINSGNKGQSGSVSSVYGVPNVGNSLPAQPNRNFGQSINNPLSTSYRPLINDSVGSNSPSGLYGAPSPTQGIPDRRKEQSKLSTSYGPPDAFGTSFENFPSNENAFQPTSNSLGFGNTALDNSNNQFSSLQQSNVGNRGSSFSGENSRSPFGSPSPTPINRNPIPGGGNIGEPTTSNRPSGNSFGVPGGFDQKPIGSFGSRDQNSFVQGRPSPVSLYGLPSNSFDGGNNPPVQNQGFPSSSYGPPSSNQREKQNQANQFSYNQPSNSPESKFSQSGQNQANPISSYNPPPSSFDSRYNQGAPNQARPSPSYGTPAQNSQNIGYNQDRPSAGRPFSSFPQSAPSTSLPATGYNSVAPAPSGYDSSQTSLQSGYNQKRPNEVNPFLSQSRPANNPPASLYGPPSNRPDSFPNQFDNSRTPPSFSYQQPSNSFQPPLNSFGPENTFKTPPRPFIDSHGSTASNAGNNFPTTSNGRAPSGTFSAGNSNPFSPSGSSVNSFEQDFTSSNYSPYSSTSTSSGFGAYVSPTYEAPLPNSSGYEGGTNISTPNSIYGAPTKEYNNAFTSDKSSSSYNPTFSTTPSQAEQFFNNGKRPQSEYGAPINQGILQSSSQPFGDTNDKNPLRDRPSNPSSNYFTGGENSLSNPTSFPTNSETSNVPQEQNNVNTNAASSYLPPSYDPTGFPSEASYPFSGSSDNGIVPSTSYTLPSGESSVSKGGTPNVLKNANRNVGSDLITGASTSPFRPFNDDSPANPSGTNNPSRATYEKSVEVTNNDIPSTGSDSSEPASYEFNYNVKQAGTEFNHQESRNGSTTSGSYGVVLPDGRKQVVDYEANQEGFHPKIRYEENTQNFKQENQDNFGNQNTPFGSTQNQGYNYSPSNLGSTGFGSSYNTNTSPESFNDVGSSPQFNQELQPPYPSDPNYNQDNQGTYSTPSQGSASNFNTYRNQGTSPSDQGSSYNPSQSGQDSGSSSSYNFGSGQSLSSPADSSSRGYDYTPSSNPSNIPTVYDSTSNQGYPRGPNTETGAKQTPFFT